MEGGLECWGVGEQIVFRGDVWRDECHGGVSIVGHGRCPCEGGQSICSKLFDTQTRKHASTQTRKHANTQARKHASTQARKHANTQTRKHANTQTRTHANTQTRKHVNTQTRKHANTQTRFPPPGTPSDAHLVYSIPIGKPQRFQCSLEPAGLRSGRCAMSHTRRLSPHSSSLLRGFSHVITVSDV